VELEEAPGDEGEETSERKIVDTSEQEINHLKDVINNQQDAMSALRAQLEEHAEVEGMDAAMKQLEDFEKQSTELERCLQVLESENERLKAAQNDSSDAAKSPGPAGGVKGYGGWTTGNHRQSQETDQRTHAGGRQSRRAGRDAGPNSAHQPGIIRLCHGAGG